MAVTLMAPTLDRDHVRRVALESLTAEKLDYQIWPTFHMQSLLNTIVRELGGGDEREETVRAVRVAALGCVNDLLRTGVIALGSAQGGIVWEHHWGCVTDHGKMTLANASRDPANRAGYLAYLEQGEPLDATTRGYVEESLDTYTSCCYRATAVMIGAAVEHLVLDLRDTLVDRLEKRGEKPSKDLKDWKVKAVVEAIADKVLPDLRSAVKADESLRPLKEDAESRLTCIAAEFRRLRNEAGHPAILAPVQAPDVHANLLLFPSTVKLLRGLKKWVAGHY